MCWLQHATLLRHYPQFLLAVVALLGGLECFAGAWAWPFLRGFNGVFIGAFVGAMIALVLLHNPFLAIAGLALGAIGGAILFASVEFVGTFCVSLFTGASCFWIVTEIAQLPLTLTVAIVLILTGLATAGVVIAGGRGAVVVLTSFAGAQQLAAVAMAWMYPRNSAAIFTLPELGVFLTLAVAGMVVQWKTAGRASRPAAEP